MRSLKWMLLLLLTAAACGSPQPSVAPTPEGNTRAYRGLQLEALGAYQALFMLRFAGEQPWSYRLDMRSDGSAQEAFLHIEGVDAALNPGDVRMVVREGVSRMRGPGTDDVCLQFPSDIDLASSFITPDDLFPVASLPPFRETGQTERIAGIEAARYVLRQPAFQDWHAVQLDQWVDLASGATLRYDIQASGPDPLFATGQGELNGRLLVTGIGPQEIEAVQGCELDLPIRADATRLIKLPGLVAYESASSVLEIATFYALELPKTGWEQVSDPQVNGDVGLLSYQRGAESLEINIERQGEGVVVELFTAGE